MYPHSTSTTYGVLNTTLYKYKCISFNYNNKVNTEWQNTAKVDKYRQNTMATVVFENVSQNAKNLFDRK